MKLLHPSSSPAALRNACASSRLCGCTSPPFRPLLFLAHPSSMPAAALPNIVAASPPSPAAQYRSTSWSTVAKRRSRSIVPSSRAKENSAANSAGKNIAYERKAKPRSLRKYTHAAVAPSVVPTNPQQTVNSCITPGSKQTLGLVADILFLSKAWFLFCCRVEIWDERSNKGQEMGKLADHAVEGLVRLLGGSAALGGGPAAEDLAHGRAEGIGGLLQLEGLQGLRGFAEAGAHPRQAGGGETSCGGAGGHAMGLSAAELGGGKVGGGHAGVDEGELLPQRRLQGAGLIGGEGGGEALHQGLLVQGDGAVRLALGCHDAGDLPEHADGVDSDLLCGLEGQVEGDEQA